MIRTLKSKKGITIIALIITVVVLLILAGISVSLVVDKDGLLNSSKETKEEVRAKMIEQKKEVWSLENQLNKGTSQEITLEQFLESLETDGMITSEEKQEIIQEIPLEKIGKKEEIVKCIEWLLNDNYVTGQIIGINNNSKQNHNLCKRKYGKIKNNNFTKRKQHTNIIKTAKTMKNSPKPLTTIFLCDKIFICKPPGSGN